MTAKLESTKRTGFRSTNLGSRVCRVISASIMQRSPAIDFAIQARKAAIDQTRGERRMFDPENT